MRVGVVVLVMIIGSFGFKAFFFIFVFLVLKVVDLLKSVDELKGRWRLRAVRLARERSVVGLKTSWRARPFKFGPKSKDKIPFIFLMVFGMSKDMSSSEI